MAEFLAAAQLVLTSSAYGAITWGQVIMAAYVAGSAVDSRRRMRHMAADARSAALQGRSIMVRSAVQPSNLVYGTAKVSGPVADMFKTGDKDQFMHVLVCLAGHEIDAVEAVYFDEVALSTPDSNGFITSGAYARLVVGASEQATTTNGSGVATLAQPVTRVTAVFQTFALITDAPILLTGWSHTGGSASVTGLPAATTISISYEIDTYQPRVRIHTFLGAPGQTVPSALLTETVGRRTSAHTGQGLAWLWVRLEWDQEVFGQVGLPNISARVRGKKVYDPRSALTVWAANAALCVADYLRDATLGLGCTSAQVPAAEVITAANICDEMVALDGLGATQKRYTCNGGLSEATGRLQNLDALVEAMAGQAVWVQGRWLLRAGAHPTPQAWTLGEDHLAGSSVQVQRRAPRRELFNAVTGTYIDPAHDYAQVQFPSVENATYQTQDGDRRVTREVQFEMVDDAVRAQRLAKIMMERARQSITLTVETNLRAYDLAPGDVVPVTLARYGWSGKLFEVRRREWNVQAGTLRYVLRETAAAVWAWNYGEATVVDPAPDTDLPNPFSAPTALASLAAASGTTHLLPLGDGTQVVRASLTWTASTDAFVLQGGRIELQWKLAAASTWNEEPALPGSAAAAYIGPLAAKTGITIRARTINNAGRHGPYTTIGHVVQGKGSAASAVAVFAGAVAKGRISWTWNACADADYGHTEVRTSDANWGSNNVQPLYRGRTNLHQEVVAATGSVTRYAKHFDFSGNASTSAVSATVTVNANNLANDGLTHVVSNPAHSMPADGGGVVTSYTGSGTVIQVWEGVNLLTFKSSIANASFTIGTPVVTPGAAITVGARSGQDTMTATVAVHSGASAGEDVISIAYPITARRANGSDVVFDLLQSLTKTKAGNLVKFAYKRANTAPATPSGNYVPSGWNAAMPAPDGTGGWMSQAEHTTSGTLVGSWSTPAKIDNGAADSPVSFGPSTFHVVSGSTATAKIKINTDGTIWRQAGSGADIDVGNWYVPATGSPGSSYRARAVFVDTANGTGVAAGDFTGTLDGYVGLSSQRVWALVAVNTYLEGELHIEISPAAGGPPIVTGVVTFSADGSP